MCLPGPLEHTKSSLFISLNCTEGVKLLGPPAQAQLHSDAQSLAQDPRTGAAEPEVTPDDDTPNAQQPLPSIAKDGKDRSSISEEALTIARKTFKSVEIGSGAIPVVGSYVGAAAKVGLAFVDMLQVHCIAWILSIIALTRSVYLRR